GDRADTIHGDGGGRGDPAGSDRAASAGVNPTRRGRAAWSRAREQRHGAGRRDRRARRGGAMWPRERTPADGGLANGRLRMAAPGGPTAFGGWGCERPTRRLGGRVSCSPRDEGDPVAAYFEPFTDALGTPARPKIVVNRRLGPA